MPSAVGNEYEIPAIALVSSLFHDLLERASQVKTTATIEPPLNKADFEDLPARLAQALTSTPKTEGTDEDGLPNRDKAQTYAVIETVARDMFNGLIATTSIDSPDFVRVWNLFDILSMLSDSGKCEPALLFWLVEELLESQTIAGCRKIFDFLESRREKITAKNFEQKKLVILRTCNELLRRLSRAEDTAFCGRVFIFMFQSFPLGDKSSVNLRGEYHVENETAYDKDLPKPETSDKMEVDVPAPTTNGARSTPDPRQGAKAVSFDGKKQEKQAPKPLPADELYPIFWSLQSSFSQPKRLFDLSHFDGFKAGLEATMTTFTSIKPDPPARTTRQDKQDKQSEDPNRAPNRKHDEMEKDDLADSYNPKYLTSRDLFELEISDLSFRRHVLVQALIVMDFLLSLSAKAKEKLSSVTSQNKSVAYADQVLSEDNTKWALEMKRTIADYLKQGSEGPYFYRMVETVLSRDKNWVRWKVENCPPIEQPQIEPQVFNEAKAVARRMATSRRPHHNVGSLNLDFLIADDNEDVLAKLTSTERTQPPDLMSFKRKIADDDFEIEMPTDAHSKAMAIAGKSSKTWRALRIASRYKLASFDKIESSDKIDAIFEDDVPEEAEDAEKSKTEDVEPPTDHRPITLVGPHGIGKSSLVKMLQEKNPGAFKKVPSHTTRKPAAGEQNGVDYHFVDKTAFSMIRDGDQFLQFTDTDGDNYGTSRRMVEDVTNGNEVALLVMDHDGAKQVKDLGFAARFVFIYPSTPEALEARLKENGAPAEAVVEALTRLPEDLEHANTPGFYDSLFIADDLEETYGSLRAFIYGEDKDQPMENGDNKEENGDQDTPMDGDKDTTMDDSAKDTTMETDAKDTTIEDSAKDTSATMDADSTVNGGATETEPEKEQGQEQAQPNGA